MLIAVPIILLLLMASPMLSVAFPSPNHDYNRFLVAGTILPHSDQYQVALNTSVPGPNNFTYISTFQDTIVIAESVYYTTQSIEAKMMSNLNGSIAFLQYKISMESVNETILSTQISGYFGLQYFNAFTFRYLLVIPGIPWLGSYMLIQEFNYTSNNVTLSTPMPTKYTPGNNVSTAIMIRDIQL